MISDSVNADALLAAIAHRRSMGLSRFSDQPIDKVLIEKMLIAANWGQSHEDTEPWRYTVFMGEGREQLAEIFCAACEGELTDEIKLGYRKRAFAAPVWISIGMVPARKEDGSLKMNVEEEIMAVACAAQNLHLMASALGVAGMWHSKGPSVHPAVAAKLGLEAPDRLFGFFMLGWPNTDWFEGKRGPWEEKVTWVESA